jgi:hypothetical protein
MADAYLIWSNEHAGWWKAGGWGYARGLNDAGRFTREQALRICRDAIPTAPYIGRISELPVRLADVEEFISGKNLPASITSSIACTKDRCRSPSACSGFGYCRNHNL